MSSLSSTTSSSCYFELFSYHLRTFEKEGMPIYYGSAPLADQDLPADHRIGTLAPHSSSIRKLFQFQRVFPHLANSTITYSLCSCGHIHATLTTLTPIAKGSPIHVGDPPFQESDFVLQFDGGAFRSLSVGGAGIVLWKHQRGILSFLDSTCIPLYPCPDAAHAEASGAAGAIHLAASHFPAHSPSRILVKGDNRAVIDFMTNTGKFRRADLQRSLESAHHLLAFRLPPCIWSYTPREFNKCADFLAGIARDQAREHLSLAPTSLLDLAPFPFPLPPSLAHAFSPPPPLQLAPAAPSFTFPEQSSLSPSLLPLLFNHYSRTPHILKYLRALSRTPSSVLPTLMIAYKPSAPDLLGRLYPFPFGAAKLPKELRHLLFGRTHPRLTLSAPTTNCSNAPLRSSLTPSSPLPRHFEPHYRPTCNGRLKRSFSTSQRHLSVFLYFFSVRPWAKP